MTLGFTSAPFQAQQRTLARGGTPRQTQTGGKGGWLSKLFKKGFKSAGSAKSLKSFSGLASLASGTKAIGKASTTGTKAVAKAGKAGKAKQFSSLASLATKSKSIGKAKDAAFRAELERILTK